MSRVFIGASPEAWGLQTDGVTPMTDAQWHEYEQRQNRLTIRDEELTSLKANPHLAQAPKSKPGPMMKDAYIRFVAAHLKGQVEEYEGGMMPANYGWGIPHFDFDHIDDPNSKDMWPRQIWDDYWSLGSQMIKADTFHLPFPECVYLFRYFRDGIETINILHLREDDDAVFGDGYFLIPQHSRAWSRSAFQFALMKGDGTIELARINGGELVSELDPMMMDVRADYTKAIVATLFLSMRAKTSDATHDRSPSQANMNNRLANAGAAALPALIRVRAKTSAQMEGYVHPPISTGRVVAPHFRRGHYRTLTAADGSKRRISVRPSAIHGGDAPARAYKVVA